MRICINHFTESDYCRLQSRAFRLNMDAVPTVHCNGTVVPSSPKIRTPPSSPVMPRIQLSPGSTPKFRLQRTLRTYARRAKNQSTTVEGNYNTNSAVRLFILKFSNSVIHFFNFREPYRAGLRLCSIRYSPSMCGAGWGCLSAR